MKEDDLKDMLASIPSIGRVVRTEYAHVPLVPQAKQSVRFTKFGPAYPSKKKVKYMKDLKGFLRSSFAAEPMTGPLRITLLFCFPWRKAEKKATKAKGWDFMDKRPDIDNLMKPFFDSCNDICFDDDGQIVSVSALKIRTDEPGIFVKLEELQI